MTSHFTGTTKTEDGVTESSVWRGASSDDCEKRAARVQTWRAAQTVNDINYFWITTDTNMESDTDSVMW